MLAFTTNMQKNLSVRVLTSPGKEEIEYGRVFAESLGLQTQDTSATSQEQSSVPCSLKCIFQASGASLYIEIMHLTSGPGSFDLSDSQKTSAHLTFFLSLSSVPAVPTPHLQAGGLRETPSACSPEIMVTSSCVTQHGTVFMNKCGPFMSCF